MYRIDCGSMTLLVIVLLITSIAPFKTTTEKPAINITAPIIAKDHFRLANGNEGHCVWYGTCGQNEYGKDLPCLYEGPPKPLTDNETIAALKKICPELVPDGQDEPRVCCNDDQIENLIVNMRTPEALGFGRCPSCISNFRKTFCQSTCSPKQNMFLKVISSEKNLKDGERVTGLQYFMSKR
ncbi:NPC intracellular cholesterol transporter 1-like [Tachypleus tridentatus]|uniref:NPC intracellular cholesterol transporter 1-like n=1 Tax=Tachypleus tridentatus TaxID=6853 RepID=UPI003FD32B45